MLINCAKHGDQPLEDYLPYKLKSGNIGYHCKKCRKEIMRTNYVKNKNNILSRNKKWRSLNREKRRQIDRVYYRDNKEKISPRQRISKRKWEQDQVKNLSDRYVKYTISKRSTLKFKEIPDLLIELKRCSLIIKRAITQHRKNSTKEKYYEKK